MGNLKNNVLKSVKPVIEYLNINKTVKSNEVIGVAQACFLPSLRIYTQDSWRGDNETSHAIKIGELLIFSYYTGI